MAVIASPLSFTFVQVYSPSKRRKKDNRKKRKEKKRKEKKRKEKKRKKNEATSN